MYQCASELSGGLGNRLFIVASGMGIANRMNKKYILDSNFTHVHENRHQTTNHDYFFRNIPQGFLTRNKSVLCEEGNLFADFIPYPMDIKGDVLIKGYRQTEKYFEHIESEIRIQFSPSADWEIPSMIQPGSAFIHIRRGDYLKPPHSYFHHINLTNYYERAKSLFSNVNQWLIFSDDIGWCKQQTIFQDHKTVFVDETNEVIALWMLSKCDKGGICANSTFSWWGSWLNPNIEKRVIMPSVWTTNTKCKDIYFKNVEVLNI